MGTGPDVLDEDLGPGKKGGQERFPALAVGDG